MEQCCRLCLKPLSKNDSYYKIAEHVNYELKEKISTLISGSPKVLSAFQCNCPSESSGLCPKPSSICVQCKLDLDFYVQFSQRAKAISKRLDGLKCSEVRAEIDNLRAELCSGEAPEGRPVLKKAIDSSGSWAISDVMTRDGKVAIPRLKQRLASAEEVPDHVETIEIDFPCGRSGAGGGVGKPHVCREPKTSSTKSKVVNRTKISSGSQPYRCSFSGCQKAYRAKHYLVDHERNHTGEKPFACKSCGKAFSRILNLKKHNLLKLCTKK